MFVLQNQVSKQTGLAALALLVGLASISGTMRLEERDLASMAFPQHRATNDQGDILDEYPEYLQFALTIGRDTNPRLASEIETRYRKLRRADEKLAARFLKGLRFEMVQKLELVGMSPKRVTTQTPALRRWVTKYLGAWLREVDEYQFRAYALAVSKNH